MTVNKSSVLKILVIFFCSLWIRVGSLNAQTVKEQAVKFQHLIALIDAFYVDTVNVEKLTEDAIVRMLSQLDPHSVYISSDEVEEMNEPLQGSFSGIGIQFNILRDTLMVVSTIPGGPSEKVGMRAGDRILRIDEEDVAGIGLKNSGVRKRLRGEKGSVVTLYVKRKKEKGLLEFVITRDQIPIHSLDAAYMIDDQIGYVKLNRFAATTTKEFLEAVMKLQKHKMKSLILDLRGNGGGYMSAAIDVVDFLMEANKLIVYTEGLSSPRHENYTTPRGLFTQGKVVVLIDEGSASASEIVAGALQDWDRGVIIGRRSFGKGLVQRQFSLSDGAMIRLTTAHYYTPTGRCIQRPYGNGSEDYYMDIIERYNSGEMLNVDSIHFPDSLKYNTLLSGRTVYGGGGIMPDIYVPLDTTRNFRYLNNLVRKNVLYPFVVNFLDKHRETLLRDYPNFDKFNDSFIVGEEMLESLISAAEEQGVEKSEADYLEVKEDIKMYLKSLLARDMWETNEYFKVINKDSDIVIKALEFLKMPGAYGKKLK